MIAAIVALAAAATPAPQEEPGPPRAYSLSDPAPPSELRPFSPDRPDFTEGPFTVDAGHVQIELSAAEYTIGRDRSRTLDALPVNLKLGLSNSIDVELLFTPYQRVEDGGSVDQGFGDDTRLRLKVNLQGNDHQGVALAVIPYVKLPTGTGGLSNDHVEAGLILPLATDLPGGFSLSAMIEGDLVYCEEKQGYGLDLIHSASVSHDIAGPVSGYVEYVGLVPQGAEAGRASRYQASASAGFVIAVRDDLLLDAGTRIGFSGEADRAVLFVGAATRF
jgi:hypothetical protein